MTQLSTANHQEKTIMRTAVKLLACSVGALTLASAHAATNVVSDPVGFYKVALNEGANFVSAPLHKVHTYRGVMQSATADTVTFNGSPNFAVNEFAQVTISSYTRNQYILIVRNTSGANAGDWWPIVSNTANSVTVINGGENLATALAANTQLEVRKLTSFKDLFGSGADSILNKSANLAPNVNDEDVVRWVNGTAFSAQQVILYSVDNTYRIGAANWGDGSQLTIDPDEPVIFFRKAGTGGTNIVSLGQVHTRPLTHYFNEGATTFATPFPLVSPWNSSGLIAAGPVGSVNLAPNAVDEDVIRPVNGTAFETGIIYYTGTGSPSLTGQFTRGAVAADSNPAFQITPGRGYVYFRKAGAGSLVWRHAVPFTP